MRHLTSTQRAWLEARSVLLRACCDADLAEADLIVRYEDEEISWYRLQSAWLGLRLKRLEHCRTCAGCDRTARIWSRRALLMGDDRWPAWHDLLLLGWPDLSTSYRVARIPTPWLDFEAWREINGTDSLGIDLCAWADLRARYLASATITIESGRSVAKNPIGIVNLTPDNPE